MTNTVTINDHTYTDDGNASTGMANGGHRTRLIPLVADVVATASGVATNAGIATTKAGEAAASAGVAATQSGIATAQATISTSSAQTAANSVLAQLTTLKTQTETARDEAIAGLGAADQSQNLVLLSAGIQMALDVASQAVQWPLTIAQAELLVYSVGLALDLAGIAAKQVAGGIVQVGAGTSAEPSLWPTADRNTGLYFPAADAMALVTAGLERLRVDASGNLGVGTNAPSGLLDVNDNRLRVRTAKTPATAAAAGNAGEICWDDSYVYVAIATNTWKRSALTTW